MIVEKLPVLRRPRRKGSVVSVPGSNGSIAMETGGFETYVQPYEVAVTNLQNGVAVSARNIADWLLNSSGFLRLEDSFEPDVFRLARFSGPFDIEPVMDQDGKATIEFEVQPQRYLKIGENRIRISRSASGDFCYLRVELNNVTSLAVSATGDAENASNFSLYEGFPEEGEGASVSGTDGYSEVNPSNYEGKAYKSAFIQGGGLSEGSTFSVYLNGKRVFAYEQGASYLYNPTSFPALPLIRAESLDTRTSTEIIPDMTYNRTITTSGYRFYNYISSPLAVSGSITVIGYSVVTLTTKMEGNGCVYAFYDSDGELISGRWGKAGKKLNLNNSTVRIPSGAETMYVGCYDDNKTYRPEVTLKPYSANEHSFFVGDTLTSVNFGEVPVVNLDSELHDAYYEDGSNANDKVSFSSLSEVYASFPKLSEKYNAINLDGTSLSVTVVPRWWVL